MFIKVKTLVITCITQSWVPIASCMFVNGENMIWIASFWLYVIPFVFSRSLTIASARLLMILNVIHNMWNLLCNIFSMGQGLQLTIIFTPLHNVPKNHHFHPKAFSTTSQNVGIYTWINTFFWHHWVELENVINICKNNCPPLAYTKTLSKKDFFFFFFFLPSRFVLSSQHVKL